MKRILYLTLKMGLFSIILVLSSCYADKEEVLYRFDNQTLSPICDTSNVTYTLSIAPIMQSYCNACHNVSNASAGWVTDNYDSLKIIALNGKLLGTITHAAGDSAMPQGGTGLNSCDIAKVRKWISSGTLHN